MSDTDTETAADSPPSEAATDKAATDRAPQARPRVGGIPTITAEEMISLDERLPKEGVRLEAVVNRVGFVASQVIQNEMLGTTIPKEVGDLTVTALIGTGNKGAAALAAAKNLLKAGATVNIVLARKEKDYQGICKEQYDALRDAVKKVYKGYNERAFEQADILLDGLIGVGLKSKPRASLSLLIKGANFSMKPVVALDLPSGLDPTTGVQSPVTVKAAATVVVGLPKRGMLGRSNQAICGDLWLMDAGFPPAVVSDLLGEIFEDPFGGKEYVKLDRDA